MSGAYSSIVSGGNPRRAEDGRQPDRDERFVAMTQARGDLSRGVISATRQGCRNQAWGGALRRMVSPYLAPSRQDELKFVTVPGRYVPVGFARYAPPTIDPLDYTYYRVAGWRVAVPRTTTGRLVKDLLYRIFNFGPQSAGYVRLGDTLVPAALEIGDRMTLAQAAIEYEPYPLTQ